MKIVLVKIEGEDKIYLVQDESQLQEGQVVVPWQDVGVHDETDGVWVITGPGTTTLRSRAKLEPGQRVKYDPKPLAQGAGPAGWVKRPYRFMGQGSGEKPMELSSNSKEAKGQLDEYYRKRGEDPSKYEYIGL